jgi:hypothetical protein
MTRLHASRSTCSGLDSLSYTSADLVVIGNADIQSPAIGRVLTHCTLGGVGRPTRIIVSYCPLVRVFWHNSLSNASSVPVAERITKLCRLAIVVGVARVSESTPIDNKTQVSLSTGQGIGRTPHDRIRLTCLDSSRSLSAGHIECTRNKFPQGRDNQRRIDTPHMYHVWFESWRVRDDRNLNHVYSGIAHLVTARPLTREAVKSARAAMFSLMLKVDQFVDFVCGDLMLWRDG